MKQTIQTMKQTIQPGPDAGAHTMETAEDLVRWIDPLIGSVGEGNTFPGSCYPFGLVQASPDTGESVTCSGYKHTDTTIRGFSQTHLNGTGCPAMGDILLMPFTGAFDEAALASPFRKETQVCAPDGYAVTLENGGIRAEATTSPRVAWWRFTWPAGAPKRLYVDAAAMLMRPWDLKLGPRVPESSCTLAADRTGIAGGKRARGWTLYRMFYDIAFDRPWADIRRLASDAFDGAGDRFVVEFDGDGPVTVQVALSTVSEDGARQNREAETRGATFESVRAANRAAWNGLLSRARLVKGTDGQKTSWYTALYHLCIQPNVQTDVDGRYRTADDRIATAQQGHYSTLSLWDTFRAAHPLYTLIAPERVGGFVDSLLSFGRHHGHLPMWAMWADDTHDMIGIHSIPVLVDAWAKDKVCSTSGFANAHPEVKHASTLPESLCWFRLPFSSSFFFFRVFSLRWLRPRRPCHLLKSPYLTPWSERSWRLQKGAPPLRVAQFSKFFARLSFTAFLRVARKSGLSLVISAIA